MRIIAGPCQHESLEQSMEIAEVCRNICRRHGIEYVFKASYDKANRSSLEGRRGVGMDSTLEDFGAIKQELGVDTLTDVHDVAQVRHIMDRWSDHVDVLQIPAFLCRQTDLIREVCDTVKIVNIKKGQFLAPWDVAGILSKTDSAKEVWITERGTTYGYNTLVVDFTGMDFMLRNYDVPIVFDLTHSVQKPGGMGMSSGGNREYVPGLGRAGAALGISNFFIEVHADPDRSPSDGPNMVALDQFADLVTQIYQVSNTANNWYYLR